MTNMLNDPPDQQVPSPVVPPFDLPEGMAFQTSPSRPEGPDAVSQALQSEMPVMESPKSGYTVELPAGWLNDDGSLVTEITVRELTGFDEERLSRFENTMSNAPKFVTDLLSLCIVRMGDFEGPLTKEVVKKLLIGDREAIMVGIRRATYGDLVENLVLQCIDGCGKRSEIVIDLTDPESVPMVKLKNPEQREFDLDLRVGKVKVVLLDGGGQEEMASGTTAKTTNAEVTTMLLAKSVVAINDQPTSGNRGAVLGLPGGDRQKIVDFLSEHNFGPRLRDIQVPCATCGKEYSYVLGIGDLFRF